MYIHTNADAQRVAYRNPPTERFVIDIKKERGLITSSTFPRYRQTPKHPYTSKSPRRSVSVSTFTLRCFLQIGDFEGEQEYQLNAFVLYVFCLVVLHRLLFGLCYKYSL